MNRVSIHKTAILHCLNRGVLKTDIFFKETDWWRFLEILRYKNHDANIHRWQKDIRLIVNGHNMPWPDNWSGQQPLVSIAGYTLMSNHYHLILEEIEEGGVALFMKKLSNSYTAYVKHKYDREERLFSGRYKSIHVLSDNHLRKLFVYVLVKNVFERQVGDFKKAIHNFDEVFQLSRTDKFSSLAEVMGNREPLITDSKLFNSLFSSPQEFKEFSREQMQRYEVFLSESEDLFLE